MFSYYGSKSKLINLYPEPKHSRIIEPFAGSARYALEYFDREIILVELNKTVYNIWYWLIHEASVSDIKALPDIKYGQSIAEIKRKNQQLTQVECDFMGFACTMGTARPGTVVTARADPRFYPKNNRTYRPNSALDLLKDRACFYVPRIKHWEIYNVSYTSTLHDSLNLNPATWYIDPPYQSPAGAHYPNGNKDINYAHLAEWCKSRNGQVIVCEGVSGEGVAPTWLPFETLSHTHRHNGNIANRRLEELVWLKD